MPITFEDLCEDVLEIIIKVESDPNPQQLYSEEDRINLQKPPPSSSYSFGSQSDDYGDNKSEHDGQSVGGDADEDITSESNSAQEQGNTESDADDNDAWGDGADDKCLQDGSSDYTNVWDEYCYVCRDTIDRCTKFYRSDWADRTRLHVQRCRGEILCMESISTMDILNLRLTSKLLREKLFDAYRRILQTSRFRRTGIVPVWMSYRGLRSFCASTTNGLIAQNITSLHINLARVNMRNAIGEGNSTLLDDQLGFIDTYEKFVEQEWATAVGEDVRLLKEAFSRLPNLRNIYVGNMSVLPRGGYTLQYSYKPGEECEIRSAALTTIFDVLAAQPIPLEALAIHRQSYGFIVPSQEEAGAWALSIPKPLLAKLSCSLATIKRVHLTLSTGDLLHPGPKTLFKRNVAPEGFTKAQGAKALLDFISAMPQLSSLHLAAAAHNEFSLGFVRKVLRGLPDTLEELHLSNMMMSVSLLAHFLNGHRHQLTELGLFRLYLIDEHWNTIFRMMQVFLPRLQRVYIEQLWELHPAFADKVFFFIPCGYMGSHRRSLGRRIYTIGAADRVRGLYRAGQWRPQFRYDAIVMDDEDDRPKAQSLQGGLHHAVTQSKREAVDYCDGNVDDPLPKKVLEFAAQAFGKTVSELVGPW